MAGGNLHTLRPGAAPRHVLAQAEALYQDMLDGYRSRLGQGKAKKTLAEDIRVIDDFQRSSGQYPWNWGFDDWDAWNAKLVEERKISTASQRKYQGIVRGFIDYLEKREAFQVRVKGLFGVSITQFLDADDVLHHLYDHEEKKQRARFTEYQCQQFMRTIRQGILRASKLPPVQGKPHRQLLNHQRDLVMFALFISTGLRAGSVVALNTWSFVENPSIKELGKYGHIFTVGKGSKGNGPKLIHTPIDDLKLVKLLEWYEKEVRPYFLSTKNPNETAFFLAEGGKRISYQTIWARCHKLLIEADLAAIGLSPHSFRHHKISYCGEHGYDPETIRRIANHVYLSTTQGYMQVSDQYCQRQIDNNVRGQLEREKARATSAVGQINNDQGDKQ